MKKQFSQKGFTLIELLIVIAVMSILSTVVIVALDPAARFADARNGNRSGVVDALLSAIKLDQADNKGAYLQDILDLTPELAFQIGTSAVGCDDVCSDESITLQAACVNLGDLADRGKIAEIPVDQNAEGASASETRFYMIKHDNGGITIGSCGAEKGSNTSVPIIKAKR